MKGILSEASLLMDHVNALGQNYLPSVNWKFGFDSSVAEFIPQVAAMFGALVRDGEIQYRGRRLNFYFWGIAGNQA